MADSKVSELTSLTLPVGEDLLLVVDDPNGTPVSKKISLTTLFGNISANVVISGTTTASANVAFTDATYGPRITADHIIVGNATIVSNNATTQFGAAGFEGAIMWDTNYLYIAVSDTQIKRVALSVFS